MSGSVGSFYWILLRAAVLGGQSGPKKALEAALKSSGILRCCVCFGSWGDTSGSSRAVGVWETVLAIFKEAIREPLAEARLIFRSAAVKSSTNWAAGVSPRPAFAPHKLLVPFCFLSRATGLRDCGERHIQR